MYVCMVWLPDYQENFYIEIVAIKMTGNNDGWKSKGQVYGR